MNLAFPQTQPLHNLFSQVAYAASSAQMTDVWIAGKRVMKNNAIQTLDEPEILAAAESWRARLSEWPEAGNTIQ